MRLALRRSHSPPLAKRYTGLTISNSNFPINKIIDLRLPAENPL